MTTTAPILPPVLRGWSSGKPDFESNPAVGLDARKGTAGLPGIYDQIARQWGTVASHMSDGRAMLASAPVELAVPEDAAPHEVAWNRAAFAWLGEYCGIQEAAKPRYGIAPLLEWAHDVVWHGFGVLVPRWMPDDVPGYRGRVLLQPLVRSAVTRFDVDWSTLDVKTVVYQGQGAYLSIPYEDCVHIAWGGQPGELYGHGELRALVGPYYVWAGTLSYVGALQTSQAGRLVMTEAENVDEADAERYDEAGMQYAAGALPWVRLPFGSTAQFIAASGSVPDPTAACAWSDAVADRLFASRNSSLVQAANGSRATADSLGNEDEQFKLDRWDQIIADVIGGVLTWFAREVGYSGTIYRAALVRPEQASEDTTALVTTLAQAVTAGLIQWSPEDETTLRDRLGWSVVRQVATASDTAHVHTLACDHLELSEPRYETTGRDGRTIRHRMPRIVVEIQGHLIEPETGVAWLTDDDAERALEGQLGGVMAPLIDQHRAEVASAGGDPARLRALRDEYEGIYFRALLGAVPAWRNLGRSQAQEEAAGQAGTPLVSGAPDVRRVDIVETARRMRITRALQTAAREMASRVEGEAMQRPGMAPRATVAGLLASSVGALRMVEETSRIIEAVRPDETGMVVVAFVRTSMLDDRVCGHCKKQHGEQWLFPEDEAEFVAYIAEFGPPDPSCEGTEKHCRCRMVPVYGRVG